MNKFLVFPCIQQKLGNYSGKVISLACAQNINFVLFFPVADDLSKIINYLIDTKPDKIDFNTNGYINMIKTLTDTWKSSGRFLSGIYMESEYSDKHDENIISIKLIISDMNGAVDSIIGVNFIYGILLSALERKEIIVADELLKKISKNEDDNVEEEDEDYTYNAEDNVDDQDLEKRYRKEMDEFKRKMENINGTELSNSSNNLRKTYKKDKKFPVDKNIAKIVQQILSKKKK